VNVQPDSLATFRFRCATCNEVHEGLPSLGFDYPVQYLGIPEDERDERAELTSDTCVIDGTDFFVRARLEIPVIGYQDTMSWGVWISLSEKNFARFEELLDQPGREREGPWFGWFCSPLPGYPDTLFLKTYIHMQPLPLRPLVELEPTGHPLAVDQRNGISPQRAAELVEIALHPR
jgi:hypothetical protein